MAPIVAAAAGAAAAGAAAAASGSNIICPQWTFIASILVAMLLLVAGDAGGWSLTSATDVNGGREEVGMSM